MSPASSTSYMDYFSPFSHRRRSFCHSTTNFFSLLYQRLSMKAFILNFLNGFLTTLITFIILQALIYFSIELPYLPLNLEKMAIFLCVLSLLSYAMLKVKKNFKLYFYDSWRCGCKLPNLQLQLANYGYFREHFNRGNNSRNNFHDL